MVLSIPDGTSPSIVCVEDIDGELFECQYLGPEKAARFKSTDGHALIKKVHVDVGNTLAGYTYSFSGKCDGKEILMLEGPGDNDGSEHARTERCYEACINKDTPKAGSWLDFEVQGFIVNPTNGQCWCDAADSQTCLRTMGIYKRYDIGIRKEQVRFAYDWRITREESSGLVNVWSDVSGNSNDAIFTNGPVKLLYADGKEHYYGREQGCGIGLSFGD